jgi:biopolymer transport protein ExbB/TolQ
VIEPLTRVLYVISNSLLAPVIAALLGLLAWTLLLAGGFLKELAERGRVRRAIESSLAAARDHVGSADIWRALARARSGLPKRFADLASGHAHDEAVVDQALAHVEHDIADTLARHSFITRISPMLGLMGTLIPLGPALSGLASGDLSALAGNLVVAFTATVVGLLISGLAYGIGLARRTWYSRDLTDLEFVAKRLQPRQEA